MHVWVQQSAEAFKFYKTGLSKNIDNESIMSALCIAFAKIILF